MRTFLFITCLGCLALFFSCDKQDNTQPLPPTIPADTLFFPDMKMNSMSVKRNGVDWDVQNLTVARDTSSNTVYISKKIFSGFLLEWFSFFNLPYTKGVYVPQGIALQPTEPVIKIGWLIDLDQSVGLIDADTLYTDNMVEVLGFNEKTRILEGRFTVWLTGELHPDTPSSYNLSDTVLLEEGRFVVKVPE